MQDFNIQCEVEMLPPPGEDVPDAFNKLCETHH